MKKKFKLDFHDNSFILLNRYFWPVKLNSNLLSQNSSEVNLFNFSFYFVKNNDFRRCTYSTETYIPPSLHTNPNI